MAGELKERGVEDGPGGVVASGGATAVSTSADTNKARVGGRHGAMSNVMKRVSGRREKPTG